MDIQTADRVMDVGCGSGDAIKRIAAIATDGFVAGVDHSSAMVRMATMRNLRHIISGRSRSSSEASKTCPGRKEVSTRLVQSNPFSSGLTRARDWQKHIEY